MLKSERHYGKSEGRCTENMLKVMDDLTRVTCIENMLKIMDTVSSVVDAILKIKS